MSRLDRPKKQELQSRTGQELKPDLRKTISKSLRTMSVFQNRGEASQPRPKAPTSYQYYSTATTAQKKVTPPVELVFPPSGDIKSWGFVSGIVRFNIYPEDARYEECQAIVTMAIQNHHLLRIVYSPEERGLATLDVCKKKKAEWNKVNNFWMINQM